MVESVKTTTKAKSPRTQNIATPVAKKAVSEHQPRNFLAAFLLTTVCGPLGIRHFYLGDKQLGWIRSGLFVGGFVWMLIFGLLGVAGLFIVGWLAMVVASIWGIVDFFYVYLNVRHDASGKSLVATTLDRKFATVIFWVTVGAAVLSLIAFIIAISIGQNAVTTWQGDFRAHQTPGNSWSSGPDNGYYQ